MSSFKAAPMRAMPWSLDELAMPDVFEDISMSVGAGAYNVRAAAIREAEQRAREEAAHEQAVADAYAQGRADGEEAAQLRLEPEITLAVSALRDAVQSIQLHEARWLSNVEENLAAVAVAVARHIVQREVVTDPTFIRDVVLNAVSQYPVDQAITVRLNPGDLAACREILTNDVLAIAPNIQWMADSTLQRGGCLTEGRERIIDGRVDTALERVYRTLGGIQS